MTNDVDHRETLRTEIVDYLYGELDEDRRRAFEAALSEDAELRREVVALERTLGRTREALRAGDEAHAPPARVRAAALAAARARITAARPAAEVAARPRVAATGAEPSLWQRLAGWWKRPWVIPAVLATAAIALFVLGRDTIVGESSRELWKARAPVSAPAPTAPKPAEPEQAAEEVAPALAEQKSANAKERAKAEEADKGGGGAAAERLRAQDDAPLGGLGTGARAETRATAPARRKAAAAVPRAERGGESADAERSFAQPPADWPAEPPSKEGAGANEPPPSAKPTAGKRSRAFEDDVLSGEEARDVAGAGRSASSAPATASGAARAPAAAAPAPPASAPRAPSGGARADAPSEAAADVASSRASDEAERVPPRDLLVTRAREAAEAGRWSEAARLYRTLLARYPKDRDAARWRERLAESERALRAE